MNPFRPRYAFMTALLKAKEARLLTRDAAESMAQRATIADAVEAFSQTDIGRFLSLGDLGTFDDAETRLWIYLNTCAEEFYRYQAPPNILRPVEAYLRKYDVLNMTIALRNLFDQNDNQLIPVGTFYRRGLTELLDKAGTVGDIAAVIEKADLPEYLSIFGTIKEDDPSSCLQAEIRLEQTRYRELLRKIIEIPGNAALIKAIGIIIDLANLQNIFHQALSKREKAVANTAFPGGLLFTEKTVKELSALKAADIAGRLETTMYRNLAHEIVQSFEASQTVTCIDGVIAKNTLKFLKELLAPRILSSADGFWYIIIKECECRTVRLILKTVSDGIPSSAIKDYMVTAS